MRDTEWAVGWGLAPERGEGRGARENGSEWQVSSVGLFLAAFLVFRRWMLAVGC